jgi:hypothetical protein
MRLSGIRFVRAYRNKRSRPARTIFLALVLAVLWLAPDISAWAQVQFGVGVGGGGEERRPVQKDRDEPRRDHKRTTPGVGIQVDVGQIRPAYCYTHEYGGLVTCRKRSLNGETCAGDCILSGGGTNIGPAPPAHRMVAGVSYRCTCGN